MTHPPKLSVSVSLSLTHPYRPRRFYYHNGKHIELPSGTDYRYVTQPSCHVMFVVVARVTWAVPDEVS